jgi:thiol-disulfide isomerase/thioredoxin
MRLALLTAMLLASLAACAPAVEAPSPVEAAVEPPALEDYGPAPPVEGRVWLNRAEPTSWESLRGQVVLVEMWTFGCVNCQRVIPYLRDWHARYGQQGLVIVGNHYPEFGFEADLDKLRQAVEQWDIAYPVVQDNEGVNWRAYGNRYWPTTYLIDKLGHLRYRHIGEGAYAATETAIQALLAE